MYSFRVMPSGIAPGAHGFGDLETPPGPFVFVILDRPLVRHEADQRFVIRQGRGAQLGDELFGHLPVFPDRSVVPAVVDVRIAEPASGADDGPPLRILANDRGAKCLVISR